MFESLTKKISGIFGVFSSSTITDDVLEKVIREIKIALLEADTALVVVKEIIDELKEKTLGGKATKGVDRADYIIKIVNDIIKEKLGNENKELNLSANPAIIMMCGLQGSGKTTTAGKLAKHLKESRKKSVFMVSTDIYRPQAREQLEILADRAGVASLPIVEGEKVKDILKRAKAEFSKYDVIIVDTAGRHQLDDDMMAEIKDIKTTIKPTDIILCVDAVMGQKSVEIAKAFNDNLGITGIIMTRADGDAKGGAALSMKSITGASILFLGVGEKLEDLETFHPDRLASRILGMGDIVSLVEQAQEKLDASEVEGVSKRMMSGQFDFNDMLSQFRQMKKMGGIGGFLKYIPGLGGMMSQVQEAAKQIDFSKQEAIILSMTNAERRKPQLLYLSRKQRIAKGAGVSMKEVEDLIKQYEKMKSSMKKMQSLGGPEGMMEKLKNL